MISHYCKASTMNILSDCKETTTHNHLVCKQILYHLVKLAKSLSCVLSTYLNSAFDCMLLSCHIPISHWIYNLYLLDWQGTPCLKQVSNLKFKCLQQDLNSQNHNCFVHKWPLNLVVVGSGLVVSLKLQILDLFREGVSSHSGNHGVRIHSETCMWHNTNIPSNSP